MPLDLDKLKKYIALAASNPNENEARIAAMRACKMIYEDEFKCLGQTQGFNRRPRTSESERKPEREEPRTWDDVRSNKDPFPGAKDPFQDFADAFGFGRAYNKSRAENSNRWREEAERSKREDAEKFYNEQRREWEARKKQTEREREEAQQAKQNQRKMRKCVRCDKEKLTSNINNFYVCNECQWKEFEEKKAKEDGWI